MRKSRHYDELANRLCASGMDAYWAKRLAEECAMHFEDLRDAELAKGQSAEAASAIAHAEIGADDTIIGHALAHTALLRTGRRLGLLLGWEPTLAGLGASQLDEPLRAGAYLRRLGVASIFGAVVTASILFALQVSLQLS